MRTHNSRSHGKAAHRTRCRVCSKKLTEGACDYCLIEQLERRYEGRVSVAPALRLSLARS